MAEKVRTGTAAYLKTKPKQELVELRRKLPRDEQELLVLRLDRDLTWRDLAVVMADEGVDLDDQDIDRGAKRLRKRYERVKDKLKTMAEETGLLSR